MDPSHSQHFIDHGWVSIPIFTPESLTSLATNINNEALLLVFKDNLKEIQSCQAGGHDPLQLLVDPKLRGIYLQDPHMIWENGNSRQPIISKNSGMCNLYHNPYIRDWIYFNPTIYEHIKALYDKIDTSRIGEDLVYMHGPDRIGLKPQNSTDMPAHLDRSLFQDSVAPKYRIQSMITLSMGKTDTKKITNRDLGSLQILGNFHHYFHLAQTWFKDQFVSLGIHIDEWTYRPWILPKEFDNLLPHFVLWIRSLYTSNENKEIMATLPKTYQSIEWICPETNVGDLLCFDFRLPHRNTRNKSSTTRIVAYVSLFRKSDWKEGIKLKLCSSDILKTFTGDGTATHGGSNRDDNRERYVFANTWKQRTLFDHKNSHVQLVCGLDPHLTPIPVLPPQLVIEN